MNVIDFNAAANGTVNDKPYCIVTDDDQILERDLTQEEAEQALTYFLNHGEDCYIGETASCI